MKVIILAGGLGTRLSEETQIRPKPMVEIGGRPILWHIMNIYAAHGFRDFVIACGYRGEVIKRYYHDYFIHHSDLLVNLRDGSHECTSSSTPDWQVRMVDTGIATLTGGRLQRLRKVIGQERFMVTYGDGVSDIDLTALVAFHRSHGKLATVTAVTPPARFGALVLEGDRVTKFVEKPLTESLINGGFFIFEPSAFEYFGDDHTALELEPLDRLARERQLMAFRHPGFWMAMDTLRDKQRLEELWSKGQAPWKVWA